MTGSSPTVARRAVAMPAPSMSTMSGALAGAFTAWSRFPSGDALAGRPGAARCDGSRVAACQVSI